MTGKVLRLLAVERVVASLAIAVDFYCGALGFAPGKSDSPAWDGLPGQRAELRLGRQTLLLVEYETPGALYPPGGTAADLWFQHIAIVAADMGEAWVRLAGFAPAMITTGGPQLLPPATGSVTACKFRDPDGHPLELLHFPPGTGDAHWQRPAVLATLGIDHSAISVADADASIAFYRDILGFTVAARQTNRGPAQERLDGLAGDVVEVVALSPAAEATPHLELLAYQTPRGRALDRPLQPNDIAADRLVLQVDDLEAILARLPAGKTQRLDGKTAALIRDPDGHLLGLIEQALIPITQK